MEKILTSREDTHGKLFAPARKAKRTPRQESSAQNTSAKTTGDVRDPGWLKGRVLKEAAGQTW